MKKILIILVLALIGVAASGQTVYSCDYKSDAQVKVYVTKYKSMMADEVSKIAAL